MPTDDRSLTPMSAPKDETTTANGAPAHLSEAAQARFVAIRDRHALTDPAGLTLLTTAMECYDRIKRAQAQLAKDGEYISDRFGGVKVHPAVSVEEKSRAAMRDSLRALGLDYLPQSPRAGRQPSGLGLLDENLEFDLDL